MFDNRFDFGITLLGFGPGETVIWRIREEIAHIQRSVAARISFSFPVALTLDDEADFLDEHEHLFEKLFLLS